MKSKLSYDDYSRIHQSASNKRISYRTIARWYSISENYARLIDKIFCAVRDEKTLTPYLRKNSSVIAAAQVYYARLISNKDSCSENTEVGDSVEIIISLLKENNKLLKQILSKLD